MSVYQIGSVWYFNFTYKGRRYKKSLPMASTEKDARRAEVEARHAVYQGTYDKVEKMSFSAFVDNEFLPWSKENKASWRDDIYITNILKNYFRDRALDEIPVMLIEKFKKERRESSVRGGKVRRPATVNRELAVASKIFSLAVDYGVIDANPCLKVRKLKNDNLIIRYLSDDEMKRLLAALEKRPRLRAIVIVAVFTGMRLGEILSLTWRQVDFSLELIHLTKTKTGRERFVSMTEPVRTELGALQVAKKASTVFVFPSGRLDGPQTSVKSSWRKTLSEAEITHFRFHDLRHTAATWLALEGADAFTIANILGHAGPQMSFRYAHATDQVKRRALEKIAERWRLCSKSVPNEKRQALRPAVND